MTITCTIYQIYVPNK